MAADDIFSSLLPIEFTAFDLIVCGTGLPESLLAAAAAAAGKSVLHLDPNPYYGSLFSSLPPDTLASSLPDALFSHVEVHPPGPPPKRSRGFLLDIHGPRVLFCADRMVELLIRSGASNHVDFKSVEASLILWEGRLFPVPDSRQAIFKDRSLALAEKSLMMRFLKLVQGFVGSNREDGDGSGGITEEDLGSPFAEFLQKQRLSQKTRTMILYAIALADYDQDDTKSFSKFMSTKEGIDRIALYTSSFGRFANAVGAFLYPIYGHGELPQALCRCAAVKGALYILRMPVLSLLTDLETKQYKGVKLASGQDILSRHLVINPSSIVSVSVSPPSHACNGLNSSSLHKMVARAVCITNSSFQPDLANILVVLPPKSVHPQQFATIRALQLSSKVEVCPEGLFVVHFSTLCNDAKTGKEYLNAAISCLLSYTILNTSEDGTSSANNGDAEPKPVVLWSCIYIQESTKASFDGSLCICPMPDGNLDYRDLLETTSKLFEEMYVEEFFPANSTAQSAKKEEDATLD